MADRCAAQCRALYQHLPVLERHGRRQYYAGQPFPRLFASYNLKDHSEIIHINIEKADRIQEQLVAKVAELAATPATGAGEAVPIRLEVPADAAIELWDSGQPVAAHAGDTLKTLAETYHVPLWALAQINSVSASRAASEGQRIVVPRYLAPVANAEYGHELRASGAVIPDLRRSAVRGEAEAARFKATPERHRRRFAADAGIDLAPMKLIELGHATAARLRAGAGGLFVALCCHHRRGRCPTERENQRAGEHDPRS